MLAFFIHPEWNKADAAGNKGQRERGWQTGVCCQKEGKRRGCLDRTGKYSAYIFSHYDDVIMATIASHITSRTIVYSVVYSDTNQRKHQSSASLAFVREIHRDRWIPRTNGQLRGKCFHLMTSSCIIMQRTARFRDGQSNYKADTETWKTCLTRSGRVTHICGSKPESILTQS